MVTVTSRLGIWTSIIWSASWGAVMRCLASTPSIKIVAGSRGGGVENGSYDGSYTLNSTDVTSAGRAMRQSRVACGKITVFVVGVPHWSVLVGQSAGTL